MPNLTKGHAEKIAAKLEARIVAGSKHDLAKIYHGDKKIAQFGIRRGSKGDLPHPFLPGQLFVAKKDCLRLADSRRVGDDPQGKRRHRGDDPDAEGATT